MTMQRASAFLNVVDDNDIAALRLNGTGIADLFALGQAESDLSIMIESYDWEFYGALQEDTEYVIGGEITSAERCEAENGRIYDRIQFRFDLSEADKAVARSTITWHFTRNTL